MTSADVAGWVEAAAAVLAAGIALAALLFTLHQVRESAKASSLDSEERTRPYLGMNIEPGMWGEGSADLLVENYGRSTARQIRLGLDGASLGTPSSDDEMAKALRAHFSTPFDLAPGARRRIFWRMKYPDGSRHGGPESGTVVASYEWHPHRGGDRRDFADRYRFDLDALLSINPNPHRGPTRSGDPNKISTNLMAVLRLIAANIASLRR